MEEKNLLPVYEFAKKRGISHTMAYILIHGRFDKTKKVMTSPPQIVPEKIGNNYFIDWNKYGEMEIQLKPSGRKKVV